MSPAEAVNSLDWMVIYAEARRRVMNDMTGTFYDEHLARTIADHLFAKLTVDTTKNQP